MSLVNSLLSKPVEMTQLQKTAQALQKKPTGGVSNLFVNQQTDHSKYVRAKMDAIVAVEELYGSKEKAMSSLIGTQALVTDPNSPDGKASSAAIRNRVDIMYSNQRDKKIRCNDDAAVKKDNKAEQVKEAIEVALVDIPKSVSLPSAPASGRIAVKTQSASTKISIRV